MQDLDHMNHHPLKQNRLWLPQCRVSLLFASFKRDFGTYPRRNGDVLCVQVFRNSMCIYIYIKM